MRWKKAFAALLLFSSLLLAASLTYTQDGTPIVTVGTEAGGTAISNINADDALYYIIDAGATNTATLVNSDMNGNVNSWTLGTDGTAPGGTNTWTYDTATYNSTPGSGQRVTTSSGQNGVLLTGNAYQAPTGTVDQTTTNYLNWAMKFNSQTVGAATGIAMCAEVQGTIAGTANRRLYWCWVTSGALPADTTEVKYISLGSGTGTTWQSFSRTIGTDIDGKWGASTTYSISQVEVVNIMNRGNGAASTLNANYDDIYLLKRQYQEDVEHKSQASISPPSGCTLKRVVASDKFYSSSGTPTYQLQWWNTNLGSWENCGAAASQGAEGTRACDTSTNPSYYINAADSNKIRIRLYSSKTAASHSLYENYLFYKIYYPWLYNVDVQSPVADPNLCSGACTFTLTCKYSCDFDYDCTNVRIYAEWKPSAGVYSAIDSGSGDNLVLGASETNPHTFATVAAGTTDATTTFEIKGNIASSGNSVRCTALSDDAGNPAGTTELPVTVNAFVDTSISSATISFGSLDPGSSNNPASENPLVLTNTANSNTAIDTYLQATDLTGAGTIGVANLKVSKTAVGAKTSLVSSGWLSGAGPNAGYYEDTAVSGTNDYYFWLDVPGGQTAGSYSGTVTIKSMANGGTP